MSIKHHNNARGDTSYRLSVPEKIYRVTSAQNILQGYAKGETKVKTVFPKYIHVYIWKQSVFARLKSFKEFYREIPLMPASCQGRSIVKSYYQRISSNYQKLLYMFIAQHCYLDSFTLPHDTPIAHLGCYKGKPTDTSNTLQNCRIQAHATFGYVEKL